MSQEHNKNFQVSGNKGMCNKEESCPAITFILLDTCTTRYMYTRSTNLQIQALLPKFSFLNLQKLVQTLHIESEKSFLNFERYIIKCNIIQSKYPLSVNKLKDDFFATYR